MKNVDRLRPLPAGRVLELWRNSKDSAADPLERALLCNAAILAECCFFDGEPVYASAGDVLCDLTGTQIEKLLVQLAHGEASLEESSLSGVNPSFDAERFDALGKGDVP